jgi:hypothetical protein
MATTGDWSISKKSSPVKLPSQMNRNLVGSIYMYGRLCGQVISEEKILKKIGQSETRIAGGSHVCKRIGTK